MKFAEFHEGLVIEAGPYRLDGDELRRFAEAYDPQWFHVDAEAAAHGPFGGLIASGWHTCAIAMRLAVDSDSDRIGIVCFPRRRLHPLAEPGPGRRYPDP